MLIQSQLDQSNAFLFLLYNMILCFHVILSLIYNYFFSLDFDIYCNASILCLLKCMCERIEWKTKLNCINNIISLIIELQVYIPKAVTENKVFNLYYLNLCVNAYGILSTLLSGIIAIKYCSGRHFHYYPT